jgi:hypothetical protein
MATFFRLIVGGLDRVGVNPYCTFSNPATLLVPSAAMAPKKSTENDFGGMDPKFLKVPLSLYIPAIYPFTRPLQAIIDKIPPNPVTGRVEMVDIMKYANFICCRNM